MIEVQKMSYEVYEQWYHNVSNELKIIYDKFKTALRISIHPNTGYTKNLFKEYLNEAKSYNEGIYENTVVTKI